MSPACMGPRLPSHSGPFKSVWQAWDVPSSYSSKTRRNMLQNLPVPSRPLRVVEFANLLITVASTAHYSDRLQAVPEDPHLGSLR